MSKTNPKLPLCTLESLLAFAKEKLAEFPDGSVNIESSTMRLTAQWARAALPATYSLDGSGYNVIDVVRVDADLTRPWHDIVEQIEVPAKWAHFNRCQRKHGIKFVISWERVVSILEDMISES